MVVRKLTLLDKGNIKLHLQKLQGDERRLRFGALVSDDYIVRYVDSNCDDKNNKWFGVDHIDGYLVAVCHVAIDGEQAELGCSVDNDFRGHGLAQQMFERAVTWLRTKGIQDVCMHCLAENSIMKHIARKNDMAVVTEYGESDANVHLEPPTPFVHIIDAYADRMAMYDMVMKTNIKFFRSIGVPLST